MKTHNIYNLRITITNVYSLYGNKDEICFEILNTPTYPINQNINIDN